MNNCIICGIESKYKEDGLVFPCCGKAECLKKTFKFILTQNQNLYGAVQQLTQEKTKAMISHHEYEEQRLREDRDCYDQKFVKKRTMNQQRYFTIEKRVKVDEDGYIPL